MIALLDMWAILGGLAVGLGGALLLGLLLGMLAVADAARNMPDADELEVEEAIEVEMARSFRQPGLLTGLTVFSVLITVLAGFLTARWADAAPLPNAGVMGTALVVLAVLMDRGETRRVFPRWFVWSGYVLTIPAALAGGWLYLLSLSSG